MAYVPPAVTFFLVLCVLALLRLQQYQTNARDLVLFKICKVASTSAYVIASTSTSVYITASTIYKSRADAIWLSQYGDLDSDTVTW